MTSPIITLISDNSKMAVHTIDIKAVHTPTEPQSKWSASTVIVSTASMNVKSSRKIRIGTILIEPILPRNIRKDS